MPPPAVPKKSRMSLLTQRYLEDNLLERDYLRYKHHGLYSELPWNSARYLPKYPWVGNGVPTRRFDLERSKVTEKVIY